MRVFLGANVLFSASNEGSNVARLIDVVLDRHVSVTSGFALVEAQRNVALKRPAWSTRLEALAARVEVAPSVLFPLPVELDEKDRPVLCAAIRAGCDFLATGDKTHFGHLYDRAVDGVTIVSLAELAKRIAAE